MSRRLLTRAGVIAAAALLVLWLIFRASDGSGESPGQDGRPSSTTGKPPARKVSDFFPFRMAGGDFVPPRRETDRSAWVDLETELTWTTLTGGMEGYYTFSNMYLSGGALVSVVPSKEALGELPEGRAVLSGSDGKGGRPPPGEELWTHIVGDELALSELGRQVVRLPGVTYMFNDQPGKPGFLAFFEHFVPEVFVPAARSVAASLFNSGYATDDMLPTRIIFPRCGSDPSWRDDRGLNRWLLSTMLPSTIIEDATQWNDRAAGNIAYMFDHLVIVDRGAAHSAGGDTARWGKMNANAPALKAPKTFWEPFRQAMMSSVKGKLSHVGKHALPVVVLFERANNPKIESSAHNAIVEKLRGLTDRAEIHITKISGMTAEDKVALLSRTDVLIGLNGDDLLQMMWMKNGGTVIEVFEEGGFARDNEVMASLLAQRYVAVRGNGVLWKEEWKDHPLGQRGPQREGTVDVSADAVVQAVMDTLDTIEGKTVLAQDS